MDQALLLPLADEKRRWELLEAMEQAGLSQPAAHQNQLILRTAEFTSPLLGQALRRAALAAVRRSDYLAAADCWERCTLNCLRTSASFVQTTAYIAVPHLIHKLRAAGLLQAGRTDEALREIDSCLFAMPADITLPIDLVPALQKARRHKEADDLFNRVLALNRKLSAAYPRSVYLHNTIAWLLVRCRRNLDEALEHARKGVELDESNVAVIDTLAEAYFQCNEKDKAIQTIKKCIDLEPAAPRHKLALKRFEQSTPDTPPPPE
jgi:tetratricopeptide (TPR) repeat protein